MNCIWIGQAGLLFDFDGIRVMVDPYLSDSVEKVNPKNKRRVPVEQKFFDIKPDVLILTHNHLDHTDPDTLRILLSKHTDICVLASRNAWQQARVFGGGHNYVLFDRGTEWTFEDVQFCAVHAQHSDDAAIGVLITHQKKNYYITGDTLYHKGVIEDVMQSKKTVDVVFLPVNGGGNNINMTDARRFCEKIKAKCAVPIHCGLFDNIDMNQFAYEPKVVPTIYKEIEL